MRGTPTRTRYVLAAPLGSRAIDQQTEPPARRDPFALIRLTPFGSRSQTRAFRTVPGPGFLAVTVKRTRPGVRRDRRFAVLTITSRPRGTNCTAFETVQVTTPRAVTGAVTR